MKILLYGHTGFLGSYLYNSLASQGHEVVKSAVNALLCHDVCREFMSCRPELVINAAGYNMNVLGSAKHPWNIFSMTTEFALNINHAAYCFPNGLLKHTRIIHLMASCAYPLDANILSEDLIFAGNPHPTVEAHGYGKRNVQLSCKFLNQQYGIKAVTICPPTLFGPGEPLSEFKTKVVGSIVMKAVQAKKTGTPLTLWGTGNAYRDIMYIKDAADIIAQLVSCERTYENSRMPLNIGGYKELKIKDLGEKISQLVGLQGDITWDTSKPNGQYRKRLKFERMESILGKHYPWTQLDEALMETIKDIESRIEEEKVLPQEPSRILDGGGHAN